MKPEAQRIAIAEASGWTPEVRRMYAGVKNVHGWGKNLHLSLGDSNRLFATIAAEFPDYLSDLNAMHEAESTLEGDRAFAYYAILAEVTGSRAFSLRPQQLRAVAHATAAQRAEAFLRTLGKWETSA